MRHRRRDDDLDDLDGLDRYTDWRFIAALAICCLAGLAVLTFIVGTLIVHVTAGD